MAKIVEAEQHLSSAARVMRLARRPVLALIALGLLQAGAATAQAAADATSPARALAGPPLYVVEQGTAKVYILGVAGGTDDSWLTPTIRQALLSSQEFWSETPPPPTTNGPPPEDEAFRKLAFRDMGSLFDGMSQADADRLLKATGPLGVTREQLAPMRPWFAAVQLSVVLQNKEGATHGMKTIPEYALRSVAEEAHIPTHSEMASVEDYVRFMANLPEKAQYDYLSFMLDMAELPQDAVRRMDEAWARGNTGPYDEFFTKALARHPDALSLVGAGRNVGWGQRIKGMLAAGGVHFVSIGMGHMVGPDSIPVQLQRLGLPLRSVSPSGS